MPRYIIERDIPGIGSADSKTLRDTARQSNSVIAQMVAENKTVQWEHSYLAGDKVYCVYIAANAELLREHAERGGFPTTNVFEVNSVMDPVTAEA